MAERRMVSKKIVDTDLFLDMPATTRLLYYDLLVRADDDGFVGSPKKITKMVGASDDDLKLLVAKQFIIPFESGVCVIRDWKIHNYIQSDRYHKTQYVDEKSLLTTTPSGSYLLNLPSMDTECIQDVSKMDTEVRLGKVRLGKSKVNKSALDSAIDDFVEYRKKIKSPMTAKAIELLKGRLNKLAPDDSTKIKIIEQSIVMGWKGVFELKQQNNGGTNNESTNDIGGFREAN